MDCRAVCENNIFGGYRSPNVNTNPREWTFKYILQKKRQKRMSGISYMFGTHAFNGAESKI